ncbi:glycoside hydrolase family 25 protein [Sphingomonas sp. NFR15]|uniref:glycoside hydrolase family 25 protein n=1 Tax=Sphingomonas sp. NFR15 TaxID=1566282 RepID=UPI00088E292B|nr:GH25 family lysozyme [Sphingomonas sp. NFR15]SDA14000.1 lysozyme [Sphingomonas sp. NFR15]
MRLNTWAKRLAAMGVVAVLLIALACAASALALQWRPSAKYPIQGVDVSDAQGEIEWWSVHGAGADFAYVRATSGAAGRDMRFAANWDAVPKTGMRRGAMHRYSLCHLAVDQANNFNTTVPRTPDALPAAIELGFTDDCAARPDAPAVIAELRRFLTMVEAHTGKPVLLKISRPFDAAYHVTAAFDRPVWATGNFFPPDYAARPWRMWQANDMRRIDGIEGPVNWDVVRP